MIKIPSAIEMKRAGYDDETVNSVTDKTATFLKDAGHSQHEINSFLPIKNSGPDSSLNNDLNTISTNKYIINPVDLENKNTEEKNIFRINHAKKLIDDNKKKEDEYAKNADEEYKALTSFLPPKVDLSANVENNYKASNLLDQVDKTPKYNLINKDSFYRTTGYIGLNIDRYTGYDPARTLEATDNVWGFLSSLSALESDGRMIYNPDGKRSGLWALDQTQILDYHEIFDRNMREINPNYIQDASIKANLDTLDGTRGIPDDQGQIMAAWFFENLPKEIIQRIVDGDKNAYMDAYKVWLGEEGDETKIKKAKLVFDNYKKFKNGEDVEGINFTNSSPRNAFWSGKPNDNNYVNKIIGQALNYTGGQGGYHNFFAGWDNNYLGKTYRAGVDKFHDGYDKVSDYYKYINAERSDLDTSNIGELQVAMSHYLPVAYTYAQGFKFQAIGMGSNFVRKAMGGAGSFSLENILDQSVSTLIEEGYLDSRDLSKWNFTEMSNALIEHWKKKTSHLELQKSAALGVGMGTGSFLGFKLLSKTVKGQTFRIQINEILAKKQLNDPNFKGDFINGKWYNKAQLKEFLLKIKANHGTSFPYTTKDKVGSLYPDLLTPNVGEIGGSIAGLSVGSSVLYGTDLGEAFKDSSALILSLVLFGKFKNSYNKTAYSQYSNYGISLYNPKNARPFSSKSNPFKDDFSYVVDGQAGPRLYEFEAAIEKIFADAGIKRNVIWKMPINSKPFGTDGKVVDNIVTEDGEELTVIELGPTTNAEIDDDTSKKEGEVETTDVDLKPGQVIDTTYKYSVPIWLSEKPFLKVLEEGKNPIDMKNQSKEAQKLLEIEMKRWDTGYPGDKLLAPTRIVGTKGKGRNKEFFKEWTALFFKDGDKPIMINGYAAHELVKGTFTKNGFEMYLFITGSNPYVLNLGKPGDKHYLDRIKEAKEFNKKREAALVLLEKLDKLIAKYDTATPKETPKEKVKPKPSYTTSSTYELVPHNHVSSIKVENKIKNSISSGFNLKESKINLNEAKTSEGSSFIFNHKGFNIKFLTDKGEEPYLDVKRVKKDSSKSKVYTSKTAIEEFVRLQESNIVNKSSTADISNLIKFSPTKYPKLAEYLAESGQEYIALDQELRTLLAKVFNSSPAVLKALGKFDRDNKHNIQYVSTLSIEDSQGVAEIYRIDNDLYMFPRGVVKYLIDAKNIANDRKLKNDKIVKGITPKDKFEIYAVFAKSDKLRNIERILKPDNEMVKLIVELNGNTIAQISPIEMTQSAKNLAQQVEKTRNQIQEPGPRTLTELGNIDKIELGERLDLPEETVQYFSTRNSGVDLLDSMVLVDMMKLQIIMNPNFGSLGAFTPGFKFAQIGTDEYEAQLKKIELRFDYLALFSKEDFNPEKLQSNIATFYHELGHAQSGLLEFATMPDTEYGQYQELYKILLKRKIDKEYAIYDIPADFNIDSVDKQFATIRELALKSEYKKAYDEMIKMLPKEKREYYKRQLDDIIKRIIVENAAFLAYSNKPSLTKNEVLSVKIKAELKQKEIDEGESWSFYSEGWNDKLIDKLSEDFAYAINKIVNMKAGDPSNLFSHILRRRGVVANIIDINNGDIKKDAKDEFELEIVDKRIMERIEEDMEGYQRTLDDAGIPVDLKNLVTNTNKVGIFKYVPSRLKLVFKQLDPLVQQSILVAAIENLHEASSFSGVKSPQEGYRIDLIKKLNKVAETGKSSPLFKQTALEMSNLIQVQFANYGVYTLEQILEEAFRLSLKARPINLPLRDKAQKAYLKLMPYGKISFGKFVESPESFTENDWIEFISFTDAEIKQIQNPKGFSKEVLNESMKEQSAAEYETRNKEDQALDKLNKQLEKVNKYYDALTPAEKFVFLLRQQGKKLSYEESSNTKVQDQREIAIDLLNYRRSAEEVWADSFSILTTNQEMAKDLAPNLTKLFFATLERRPEMKKFYDEYVWNKSEYSKNRHINVFKQWAELMKSQKSKLALAAQEIIKTVSLAKRMLNDVDYRNLYLFSIFNSQFAQQYFLRHGAGRVGPSQDFGLWDGTEQRFKELNLNDQALNKIGDAKFARTALDNLVLQEEEMSSVLIGEAVKLGVPYEFFEAFMLAKGLIVRNRITRDDVIPGYILLEQGLTEEQLASFKETFGEDYRSIEKSIGAFQAEPKFAAALEAIDKFFGKNGSVSRWFRRYTWNQTILPRATWNEMVNYGYYIALSNAPGMIRDIGKGIAPYGPKSLQEERTGRGFPAVAVHIVSYTMYKLENFYARHLKNENMKAQFSLYTRDGNTFAKWARENGDYDQELADELALIEENNHGSVGVFIDPTKAAKALEGINKLNTPTTPILKDWVTATSVRSGDIYPYLPFILPIPLLVSPAYYVGGWRAIDKGKVNVSGYDNLSESEIKLLGKDFERWELSSRNWGDFNEETAKYHAQILKQDTEKIKAKLDYENQNTFMNGVRAAKLIKIIERYVEVKYPEYLNLPEDKRRIVEIKGRKYYEKQIAPERIYETTQDVASKGFKVIEISDIAQTKIRTRLSYGGVTLNITRDSGEIDPKGKIIKYRVVVPDIFKFDTGVDTGGWFESIVGKAVQVYQSWLTTYNPAFIPTNFAYDVGTIISADNNAYQILSKWKLKLGWNKFAGISFINKVSIEKHPTTYTIEAAKAIVKGTKLIFKPEVNKAYEEAVFAEALVVSIKDKNMYSGGVRNDLAENYLEYIDQITGLAKNPEIGWGTKASGYWTNQPEWIINTINRIGIELGAEGYAGKFFGGTAKANKIVEVTSKAAIVETLKASGKYTRSQISKWVRERGVDFTDTAKGARNLQIILPFHKVCNTIMKNLYYHYKEDANTGPKQTDWKKGRFFESGAKNNMVWIASLYAILEYLNEFGFLGEINKAMYNRISGYKKSRYIVLPSHLKENKTSKAYGVRGITMPMPPAFMIFQTYVKTLLFPLMNKVAIQQGLITPGEKEDINPGLPFYNPGVNKIGMLDLYSGLMPAQLNSNVLSLLLDLLLNDQIVTGTGYSMIDPTTIRAKRGQSYYSDEYINFLSSKLIAIASKFGPSWLGLKNIDINDNNAYPIKEKKPFLDATGVRNFLLEGEYDYSLAAQNTENKRKKNWEQVIRRKVFKQYVAGNKMTKEDYRYLAIFMIRAKKNKRLLLQLKKYHGNEHDRNWDIILGSKSKADMIRNLMKYRQSILKIKDAHLENKKKELNERTNNKGLSLEVSIDKETRKELGLD